MADSKLSELTAATSAAGADTLYLVQGSTSKKLTVANLFADVSTSVVFNDKIRIGDSETKTARGEISSLYNITYLSDIDSAGNMTMAAGVDGQIKIIVMVSNLGGHTITLQGATLANDIAFSSVGHSVTLLYNNSKWYVIGGTATVS
jgi:hypothetical protein